MRKKVKTNIFEVLVVVILLIVLLGLFILMPTSAIIGDINIPVDSERYDCLENYKDSNIINLPIKCLQYFNI